MMLDVVELTETQARELRRATTRVIRMLDDRPSRHGARRYLRALRTLRGGLEDIEQGERDELRLGLGMDGEDRAELVAWIEQEKEMMRHADSTGRDNIDGNTLNALERGIEKLRDPERVPQEEVAER